MLYVDAISFFVTKSVETIRKLIKIANVLRRKPSYLLNDLRNFNKIFRKNVTSESDKSDLKVRKNRDFTFSVKINS